MSKKTNNIINLSLKNGDFAVYVEIPKNTFSSMNMINLMEHLKKCLETISCEDFEENTKELKKEQTNNNTQNVQSKQDSFKIRERIPNNIVDVKDLNIKQAITEKALVRCPFCGQAHCLAVNSGEKIYVMERDFNSDEFNIIAEFDSLTSDGFINMCYKSGMNKLDYFSDLQSVPIISHDDFAADNDTEVFCPVCCGSNAFIDWKKAYDEPLKFFETEHLCDVCGGEIVTKMVKNHKINKCEKCGHETEYKEK